MLTYKHINQDNLTSELQKLMSLIAEHDKWFKDQDQKLEEQQQKLKEQWNYLIQHDYQGYKSHACCIGRALGPLDVCDICMKTDKVTYMRSIENWKSGHKKKKPGL
ncbi:unnamed protein product [Sphagnum jensenii]|uniref:Uncharacterized protein n=1 Tax=Sphagnum jensenii TaxID=128206 RepID=A0ABP1AB71_9BRYO